MIGLERLERVEAELMEGALRFVGEDHGVAVERDAHFGRMRIVARRLRIDERRREAGVQRGAHVLAVRRQEQVRLERLQIAVRGTSAREHAALDAELRALHGAEHAQSGHRIVAREDHDFHALHRVGVEREELPHQVERDARLRRLVESVVLQPHVRGVVGALEDGVLLLEVEQRARADRDDELIGGRGDVHPQSIDRRKRPEPRVGRTPGRRLRRAFAFALELADHGADLARRPFEIVARDVERRRDAHDGAVRVLGQNAARQ